MTRGRVAYLMSRFPHLPETFILREMDELERQGWEVQLYPLLRPSPPVMHAAARRWLTRVQPLPRFSPDVLAAHLAQLRRAPGRYAAVAGRAFGENLASPNFLVRAVALWPQAVYAARRMQQQGIQHLHAHYATHPALVAWLIHRLTGLSYSLTVHAHDIFVRHTMLATKLRAAAFVVAISEYNRQYLAQVVGAWVRAKTHVIHCGIDPAQYAPRPRERERGARFEVLTTGSLQAYKGQAVLVQACAQLRAQGIPVHCRLIGGGEERSRLERQIAALRLTGVVELVGAQPQEVVAELLPTADCYVQPSIRLRSGKMEGIPVSLMEAMASEVPVVASALSGIPELVREGETGRLVPPGQAARLAEVLGEVYADPAGAARQAQAGRALVLREFDLQANVAQLSRLFEQVVVQAHTIPAPDALPVPLQTWVPGQAEAGRSSREL